MPDHDFCHPSVNALIALSGFSKLAPLDWIRITPVRANELQFRFISLSERSEEVAKTNGWKARQSDQTEQDSEKRLLCRIALALSGTVNGRQRRRIRAPSCPFTQTADKQ